MSEVDVVRTPYLSNKAYDNLKWLALIGLPALGTFYFALAQIWNLPYGEQIVGTIVAIDTLLGALLNLAKRSYVNSDSVYDGSIDVEEVEDGVKRFTLNLNGDPNELDGKSQIIFKVNSN